MLRRKKGIFDSIEELTTNEKFYEEDRLDDLYVKEERKRDIQDI